MSKFQMNKPEFITSQMKIVAPNTAEFVGDIPDKLVMGNSPESVSSNKFGRFAVGQTVKVTFTVTDKRRRVANVDIVSGSAKKKATVTPTKKVDASKGYYLPEKAAKMFNAALAIAQESGFYNLLAVGPSGFGKTTIPQIVAKVHDMAFYRFDCARVRDPEEWFGTRELVNGETQFIFNKLVEMIEQGNTIIALDELNRVESWLHNMLFALLDSGKAEVHDREITVGPNTLFVATINQGFQYTGTMQLDEALANRFGMFLPVGPLPENVEIGVIQARTGVSQSEASNIVGIVNRLRGKDVDFDVSTRVSLNVAKIVKSGVTIPDAFDYSLGARLESVQQKNLNDAVRLQLQ